MSEYMELYHQRRKDNGYHRKELDQDINGRSRSILKRISHCIPYYCRFMGLASFSSVGTALDILLGIVPGSSGVSHENRHKETCSRRSGQKTDNPVIAQDQAGD